MLSTLFPKYKLTFIDYKLPSCHYKVVSATWTGQITHKVCALINLGCSKSDQLLSK